MHALITRPLEDAKPLAELLAGRGVECTVEPLLEIAPHPEAAIDLDGVQALLFTSANGVRAFAAKSSRRDLKVLTVGDGSATVAREAGFSDVTAAAGDVEALATLVIRELDPKAGPLFHGAASVLAGDLQGKLEAAGFTLRRAVLYEAKTATSLTHETRMNLALGGVDMVLLFSPRTARTFAELWRAANAPSLAKTTALALSAAVAREIADLGWQRIETAATPDQPAMLALVEAEIERRTPAVEPPQAETPREALRAEETMKPEPLPPLYNPPPPKQKSSGIIGGVIAALIAGAAAAVVVTLARPYWEPVFFAGQPVIPPPAADLTALQEKVDALAASGSSAGGISAEAVDAAVSDAKAAIAQEVTAISDRLGKLEQSVSTLTQAPAATATAPTVDLQPLQDRIARIESSLADVSQQAQSASSAPAAPDLSADVAALKSANDALTQQLNAARDEIKALQAQQSELSGTVGKIAAQPSVTPGEQRRTAAVVALGALRGALPLDKPYAASLKAIDDLAAADSELRGKLAPALDPLRPLAVAGAPTLTQLQSSLPVQKIAEAANAAATSDAVGAEPGWSEKLISRLSEAVTVRPVGADAEGDGPLARLARGEAKLHSGDLPGAVDEIGALQGKPAEAAAAWLAAAKARLAQDAASATLDQTATALLAPNPNQSGPEQ